MGGERKKRATENQSRCSSEPMKGDRQSLRCSKHNEALGMRQEEAPHTEAIARTAAPLTPST
ncbi:expressed protein [Arabidopsis lyrata subsp. lyrata]|nr:expressed protein [Arabidopsis lyrata subsp. lyrata]